MAIDRLQSQHLASATPNRLFADLLADLLALTNSNTAVLAEVVPGTDGRPQLGRHLGSETPEMLAVLSQALWTGLPIFSRFASLNCPQPDSLGGDLLGLPLCRGGVAAGVVVLAGRPGGYDQDLVDFLRPLLLTATVIVQAQQQHRKNPSSSEQLHQTEQHLHDVLASLDNVAWSFTLPERKILYLSPGAEKVYGLRARDMLADPDWFLRGVHPDDLDECRRQSDITLAQGRGCGVYRLVRPDGELRWLLSQAHTVSDEFGRPVRVDGTHTDITELKRMEEELLESQGQLERVVSERTALLSLEVEERLHAEEQLRESERHYRLLAENASDMVAQHTPEGVYLYVSPSCKSLLGYEPEELNFQSLFDFFHADDELAGRLTFEQVLQGAEVVTFENRFRRKDDSFAWLESTCRAVRHQNTGQVTEIISVSHDISRRKEVETTLRLSEAHGVALEQRRRLEQQVQEALRRDSLRFLSGGIAHQFNNLLTSILGFADLSLCQLGVDDPLHCYQEQIVRGAQRAAQLTRQMLEYSGNSRFQAQLISLDQVLQDLTPLVHASVAQTCIIREELTTSLPPILADVGQLRQVVLDLALNAAEAIGDRKGTITLRSGVSEVSRAETEPGEDSLEAGTYVFFEVEDDGCGMSPEVRARIFDPFYSTKFPGRGLGLSAVQGIARGHRGAVRVCTEPGRGSVFRILLPAATCTPRPLADDKVARRNTIGRFS